jgi:hypothetical protein
MKARENRRKISISIRKNVLAYVLTHDKLGVNQRNGGVRQVLPDEGRDADEA